MSEKKKYIGGKENWGRGKKYFGEQEREKRKKKRPPFEEGHRYLATHFRVKHV